MPFGSSTTPAHVVFVVMHGLSPRCATSSVTPGLHALVEEVPGGRIGLSVASLLASTSPAHATFATGRLPVEHGILAEATWRHGRFVPSACVTPTGDTLFDACATAGLPSVGVVARPGLVPLVGAARADRFWPFDRRCPDHVRVGSDGAVGAEVVVAQLDEALASVGCLPAFTLVQLPGPGALAGRFGPASAEAIEAHRCADAALAAIAARFRRAWASTLLVVVGDHGYEPVLVPEPVDLIGEVGRRAPHWRIHVQGSGAMAVFDGPDGHVPPPFDFTGIPGVEGDVAVTAGHHLLWASLGRYFGSGGEVALGTHGGPRSAGTVAAIGGGHPAAPALARVISDGPVRASAWAPTIAEVLGVSLPTACQPSLLVPVHS